MLTELRAGDYTIQGLSVGGVYTSLCVKQLRVVFDAGVAPRSFAGVDRLFLSHGHADHSGGLVTLLGLRALMGRPSLQLWLPEEIAPHLDQALRSWQAVQGYAFEYDLHPTRPGDEYELGKGWYGRAFRTHHRGPSLGYQFFRKVEKLKPELQGLSGAELAARRAAGESLSNVQVRDELAYATDTLLHVIDTHPSLLRTRLLILECSFLDDRKSRKASQAGRHVHLDDLLERADEFENEHIVLMHFSQLYSPAEVRRVLHKRCPKTLWERLHLLAPERGPWPG